MIYRAGQGLELGMVNPGDVVFFRITARAPASSRDAQGRWPFLVYRPQGMNVECAASYRRVGGSLPPVFRTHAAFRAPLVGMLAVAGGSGEFEVEPVDRRDASCEEPPGFWWYLAHYAEGRVSVTEIGAGATYVTVSARAEVELFHGPAAPESHVLEPGIRLYLAGADRVDFSPILATTQLTIHGDL